MVEFGFGAIFASFVRCLSLKNIEQPIFPHGVFQLDPPNMTTYVVALYSLVLPMASPWVFFWVEAAARPGLFIGCQSPLARRRGLRENSVGRLTPAANVKNEVSDDAII